MDSIEPRYEDFLIEVHPAYREFVDQTHEFFLQNGCKIKLELAKNGYVVSYPHTKSKRVIANFVFRKNNLVIRIYGDHVHKYHELLETLPQGMIKTIEKSPVCKRLIDPAKCNSRCPMGYSFTIGDTLHQKCRYNCFMVEVNEENIPYIRAFLDSEIKERSA